MPWHQAIHQPGAAQMQFGRKLLESRRIAQRIPDSDVIVTDRVSNSVPGAGRYRFAATRDRTGSYAMIYVPVGRKFRVRMDKISGPTVKTWWYNPRDGKAEAIGEFPNTGEREFVSPTPSEALDWILVLDDARKAFPAPGTQP
jgi:hypothetical protein